MERQNESHMSSDNFIVELFCKIDDKMKEVKRHSQSKLWPSEITTLAILFALKGVGNRAFYRWVSANLRELFPKLPERTRLFRQFAAHAKWSRLFAAEPTMLAVADSYGIELIHPRREERSEQQIGKKGVSNWRWIVGAKMGLVLNAYGRFVDWDSATANVHDSRFRPLIERVCKYSVTFTDMGFHAAKGDPDNMRPCKRGEWNSRMMVETVLSMLTLVAHFKKMGHRVWVYLQARLAFSIAMFNILVDWFGLVLDPHGNIILSLAPFSL